MTPGTGLRMPDCKDMVVEKNASIMVASSTPQITINALLSCLARFSMRKIMRSIEPTPMWMKASIGLLRDSAGLSSQCLVMPTGRGPTIGVSDRLLGSVLDGKRLQHIFSSYQPATVYHAAAYKHVPMVEHNIAEGVLNNVIGTLNTAQAALQAGVANFVLISTDKAVRPTNVMGSTKRLAEMVLQALDSESQAEGTRFCMVRFGNVLGSSGSVVPLFRRQIESGGPITLTHPDITRYFMTIPEAAQLVMQAGAMAQGGGTLNQNLAIGVWPGSNADSGN